ncbi:fatty acid desaturase family protein [Chitinophagaceae bacterium LWZ2-11]
MKEKFTKPAFLKAKGDDLFFRLRQKVTETVLQLEKKRKNRILFKTILFTVLYPAVYLSALRWGNNISILYMCYFLLGTLILLTFINLIHEAVHNTLFSNKLLNKIYIYFFDLMGANSYTWRMRHIRLHHNYPNVQGWDSDLEQSPMARIFPHSSFSKIHKYQHIYLPLLYPLYVFNWLLVRDFKDYFKKDNLVHKVITIPTIEYVKLFAFKLFFFFYILILPKLVLGITWAQIFTAFFIMLFTASLFSLLVLLSPHANIESEFPTTDDAGRLPYSWLNHQLQTTNDVREDNWFIRFFMGCFNYHIAHHLFPSINHVYYPEVTRIIEDFANENNLPYRKVPLGVSLKNHYKLLKRNAAPENIFEETM